MGSQDVPLLMWAQDIGQGAQLCLTSPVGQLVLTHPSSGQGSKVGQGRRKHLLCILMGFFLVFFVLFHDKVFTHKLCTDRLGLHTFTFIIIIITIIMLLR